MARVLGQNSAVLMFDELHFFGGLWSREDNGCEYSDEAAVKLLANLLGSNRDGVFGRDRWRKHLDEAGAILRRHDGPKTAVKLFGSFLSYETARGAKQRPCEQTPSTQFYLDVVFEAFPDARVVVMIRDPRDVLLSQKHRWRRRALSNAIRVPRIHMLRTWASYNSIVTSMLWRAGTEAVAEHTHDARVMTLRYEDFVRSPYTALANICAHVAISYEPEMIQVSKVGSSMRVDRTDDLGIDASRVGNWRTGLTTSEVFLSERITGAWAERHGYILQRPHAPLGGLVLEASRLFAKGGLALILNLRGGRRQRLRTLVGTRLGLTRKGPSGQGAR